MLYSIVKTNSNSWNSNIVRVQKLEDKYKEIQKISAYEIDKIKKNLEYILKKYDKKLFELYI